MYQSKHSGGATLGFIEEHDVPDPRKTGVAKLYPKRVKSNPRTAMYSSVRPEVDRGLAWSFDHAETEQSS